MFYDEAHRGRPKGEMVNTKDGYVKFVDGLSNRLLSVWDYDGAQLPTVEPEKRDPHPFIWLEAKTIQKYFDATHGSV